MKPISYQGMARAEWSNPQGRAYGDIRPTRTESEGSNRVPDCAAKVETGFHWRAPWKTIFVEQTTTPEICPLTDDLKRNIKG